MRSIAWIALLLVVVACGDRAEPPVSASSSGETARPFSYEDRMGWADGACLAVASPSLKAGVSVRLVPLDSDRLLDATIESGPMSPADCNPELAERPSIAGDREIAIYRLAGLAPDAEGVVIAVVDPPRGLSLEGGRSRADLDDDGRLETFSMCTASEGLSLQVYTEGVAEPRWSGYYALGYDTEPDCPAP